MIEKQPVSPCAGTFFEMVRLHVHTDIYVREHLASPKEGASIGPADIWGQ